MKKKLNLTLKNKKKMKDTKRGRKTAKLMKRLIKTKSTRKVKKTKSVNQKGGALTIIPIFIPINEQSQQMIDVSLAYDPEANYETNIKHLFKFLILGRGRMLANDRPILCQVFLNALLVKIQQLQTDNQKKERPSVEERYQSLYLDTIMDMLTIILSKKLAQNPEKNQAFITILEEEAKKHTRFYENVYVTQSDNQSQPTIDSAIDAMFRLVSEIKLQYEIDKLKTFDAFIKQFGKEENIPSIQSDFDKLKPDNKSPDPYFFDVFKTVLMAFEGTITRGCVSINNFPKNQGSGSISMEPLDASYLKSIQDSGDSRQKLEFVDTLFGLRNGYFFLKFIRQLQERQIKFAIITSENSGLVMQSLSILWDVINEDHKKQKTSFFGRGSSGFKNPFINPLTSSDYKEAMKLKVNNGVSVIPIKCIHDYSCLTTSTAKLIGLNTGYILSSHTASEIAQEEKTWEPKVIESTITADENIEEKEYKRNKLIFSLVLALNGLYISELSTAQNYEWREYASFSFNNVPADLITASQEIPDPNERPKPVLTGSVKPPPVLERIVQSFRETVYFDNNNNNIDALNTDPIEPMEMVDFQPKPGRFKYDFYLRLISGIKLGNIRMDSSQRALNTTALNSTYIEAFRRKREASQAGEKNNVVSRLCAIGGYGLSVETILKIQDYLRTQTDKARKISVITGKTRNLSTIEGGSFGFVKFVDSDVMFKK